jgi:hypothetical protein
MFGPLLLVVAPLCGQAAVSPPKPIPQMQVIPLPGGQASIERAGEEISRYYFGKDLHRPFLFPLVGPSGKSLTRMGHPRDPNGHSHHNSVWISHHDVGGVGFWNDAASSKGRIVHQRVVRYEDADDQALIEVVNHWQDDSGRTLLAEQRAMRFLPQADGQWLLVIDLAFTAPKEPVTIGKTPFGLIGVRMAKTIGVHDGGGTIRNSEGGVNEAGVFWKAARWVDYSGPMAMREGSIVQEGVTLLDHPGNPNHPSIFHVRDDGWMGAALTYDSPRTVEPGTPLKLRYGLWVHAGLPSADAINQQFTAFAKVGDLPPLPVK